MTALPVQLDKINQRLALRSTAIGLMAGMRSWTPPATVAMTYDTAPKDAGWRSWPLFSSTWARLIWVFFGINEYVADKWPRTIDRIRPAPQMTHTDGGIVGRTAVGALAAAAIGTEYHDEDAVTQATLIATLASLFGNYFFFYLRKALGQRTGIHDFTVAMMEDQLCLAMAVAVARS